MNSIKFRIVAVLIGSLMFSSCGVPALDEPLKPSEIKFDAQKAYIVTQSHERNAGALGIRGWAAICSYDDVPEVVTARGLVWAPPRGFASSSLEQTAWIDPACGGAGVSIDYLEVKTTEPSRGFAKSQAPVLVHPNTGARFFVREIPIGMAIINSALEFSKYTVYGPEGNILAPINHTYGFRVEAGTINYIPINSVIDQWQPFDLPNLQRDPGVRSPSETQGADGFREILAMEAGNELEFREPKPVKIPLNCKNAGFVQMVLVCDTVVSP